MACKKKSGKVKPITRKMKTPWGKAFKKHYNKIVKDYPDADHQKVFGMAGGFASADMQKKRRKK
jgi:hypothetical protein